MRGGHLAEFIDYVTSERRRSRIYALSLVSAHMFLIVIGLYLVYEPTGAWEVARVPLTIVTGALAVGVIWTHRRAPRHLTGYATELSALFGMRVLSSLFRYHGAPVALAYLLRLVTVGVFIASFLW